VLSEYLGDKSINFAKFGGVFFSSGSLEFYACPVFQISDFYPIFYNPTTDYVNTIACSYEVVYPL